MKPLLIALLLAQAPVSQMPLHVPLHGSPPQLVQQVPSNLQGWPKSCQRLHLEENKCELGQKSCSQRRIDYWRKKCVKDEPHGK